MEPSEPSLPPPAPFAPPTPPPLPTPPPPAMLQSQPFAPPGSFPRDATAMVMPVTASRPRNWVLGGVLSVLTAAVVAIGAYALFSDVPDDVLTDDAVELTTETPTRTEGFSYGSASTNVLVAASMTVDMSIEMDEGAQTIHARIDRTSGRTALEIDLSQLDQGEADFDVADSMGLIIDEPNHAVYITANVFTGLFNETDAGWLKADSNELDDNSGFDQMFTNPLAVTDVLSNLDPDDLGTEDVEGELLKHFQVSVDGATLAEMSGTDANMFDGEFADAIDVTYDVWVSADDHVRRISFVIDDPNSQNQASISMDIETSAESIDIELPAPTDVIDFYELFSHNGANLED